MIGGAIQLLYGEEFKPACSVMKKAVLRDLLILGVIFAVVWAVLSQFSIFPKKISVGISVAQEEKLGNVFTESILGVWDEVESPEIDSVVDVIAGRLLAQLDSSRYRYTFRVLNADEINAFTIFGGNIFIFSGLITFVDSPETLAAVLAHEIGHAERRHVVNRMAKQLGISFLFTVLSGGNGSIAGAVVQQAASTVFDRKQEYEADRFAMDLLVKAGIDPRHIGRFFEKLVEEKKVMDKNLTFISTHPHPESRIEEANKYAVPAGFSEQPFDLDWEAIQNRLGDAAAE